MVCLHGVFRLRAPRSVRWPTLRSVVATASAVGWTHAAATLPLNSHENEPHVWSAPLFAGPNVLKMDTYRYHSLRCCIFANLHYNTACLSVRLVSGPLCAGDGHVPHAHPPVLLCTLRNLLRYSQPFPLSPSRGHCAGDGHVPLPLTALLQC